MSCLYLYFYLSIYLSIYLSMFIYVYCCIKFNFEFVDTYEEALIPHEKFT